MKSVSIATALAMSLVCCTSTFAVEPEQHRETVSVLFQHELPNSPGKSLTAVTVDYPPGVKSEPHHHGKSAFLYAYVLSGTVRSQVDEEPVKLYRPGESWMEAPGAYHKVSENASESDPAKLLVIFVSDTGEKLTIPDHK